MDVDIKLRFSLDPPELAEISVAYPGRPEVYRSFRGGGFSGSTGSFTWSGAVQALSILLLRTKLEAPTPHLAGERNSLAASLDYAISRQPQWVIEMFGVDRLGNSLLQRLVQRMNPNLKRPGPTEITFSARSSISVEQSGTILQDSRQIAYILHTIENAWRPYGGRRNFRRQHLQNQTENGCELSKDPAAAISKLFDSEITRAATEFDPLSRTDYAKRISGLAGHTLFSKLSGAGLAAFNRIAESKMPPSRLGLADDSFLRTELCSEKPIRFAAAINSAGANAILWHLKTAKGYNIEIDNHFAHALEIGTRIVSSDPAIDHDLCVIAHAPAATVLSSPAKHEYVPLMLLPTTNQRVVAPAAAEGKNDSLLRQGSYRYLCDTPSTASYYFAHLARSGVITKRQVESLHREPDETAFDLHSNDPEMRAILFFPYFGLNQLFNNCRIIDSAGIPDQTAEMLLFGHSSFISNRRRLLALQIAIQDAWITLRSNTAARLAARSAYLGNPNFNRILTRCSGLQLNPIGA